MGLCRDLLENMLIVQLYVGVRLPHARPTLLQQLSLSLADVPDLPDSLRESRHPGFSLPWLCVARPNEHVL